MIVLSSSRGDLHSYRFIIPETIFKICFNLILGFLGLRVILTQIQIYPEEDHQGSTTDQGQDHFQNDVGHILDLQWEENGQDLAQTPERRTKECLKVHTKARGIDHPLVHPLSLTMMEVHLGSRILKRKRLKKSSKTRRKESKFLKIKL